MSLQDEEQLCARPGWLPVDEGGKRHEARDSGAGEVANALRVGAIASRWHNMLVVLIPKPGRDLTHEELVPLEPDQLYREVGGKGS